MEDRESLYNSAIKPAIIFIVLYVTVKQAVYMTFFDRVYWLPRGIAGFGLLFATLFLTGRQFSRRQMSWLIPVAMILAELIVIPFVEYDRLVYFYLIGCALMSLLFVDVFGLFITIAVSWVSVAIYIFVFNYSLMGQDCFADDLFYFIGVMVAQVMIFLMGRYSVSALDKSRRELEIAYRQTEELAKMKSELFTAMSHEMRTPLTVMSAYAQYAVEQIREVGANDQTFADLGVISDEARRLAEMADGTLNVLMGSAQKNGGDGRYRGAPVDVSNLTERITRLLKPIAGRKDVELSVDITAGLPPITGDADALTQLLWNILQNAIAHSGGRFVELCVKPGDGGIIITVKDDGRGISPDLLPRVFERGISGAVEGSGIGLSVCRDIARRHGGDIIMESVQGKGTRVTVSLPVTEGGDPAA